MLSGLREKKKYDLELLRGENCLLLMASLSLFLQLPSNYLGSDEQFLGLGFLRPGPSGVFLVPQVETSSLCKAAVPHVPP